MTRLTTIQTSFSSGEIDPKLRAQTNLKAYNEGATRVRNLARLATGGLERRPGTMDLAELPGLSRLVDFEFSSTQRYVVAFHDTAATIFDTDGAVLDTLSSCPWDETTMREMSYTQNGDHMIISHQTFLVMIVRTGFASFDLQAFAFDASSDNLKVYQPYYKFAADSVTLTPSAATGSITVQASASVFVAGHDEQRLRIFDNEVKIDSVTDSDTVAATVQGKLEGKLDLDAFRSKAGSGVVEVLHPYHGLATGQSMQFAGANDIGNDSTGANGIAAANLSGTFTIAVVDEHHYTFTAAAADTAASSEDGGGPNITYRPVGTAVRDWREPAIGPVAGYPAACCFHQQRLWLMGTPLQPDGYFSSNSLKPFRFDVGKGYDGDSVQGAAGLESLSTIRHCVSNGELQIFTPVGEGVFVTRPGEPITPTNQRVDAATGAGCSFVMPQIFDGATLFVQENGLSVSEFVYSQQLSRFLATPVSTLAGHLLEPGVLDLAVSPGSVSRAEQYAFMPVGQTEGTTEHDVRDGDLIVFHSMRTENIAGWAGWRLGWGKVRSVAAVGSDVFLCVERDADFRLYKFQTGEFYSLDGAVEHTNATEQTTWTLDARVRDREVGLMSERGYLGTVEVPSDGVIEIALPVTRLLAGDPYFFTLQTLTPRIETAAGSRDRMVKRITRAIVEFDNLSSAIIDGTALRLRATEDDPSVASEPFSGPYEFRVLGYQRDPTITITQEEPTFGRILGMTLEVVI